MSDNMVEMIKEKTVIDLGYLEESESWRLESVHFPSKIGGKPAWLDLYSLPESIVCSRCNKPCIFLCQIYAPVEDKDSCFHRTIFVFLCKDPECSISNNNSNFQVFRCQLGRQNQFYSYEAPVEDKNWKSDIIPQKCTLCHLCGAKGSSRCGKCKAVYYCSKEHQIIDWKLCHKRRCTEGISEATDDEVKPGITLPEFEIVMEPEDSVPEDEVNKDVRTEEQELQEFEKMVAEGKAGSMQGDNSVDSDLEKMAVTNEDKHFSKFTARIKMNPDQVLRYERGGEPLWISSSHMPDESNIPSCEYCGANRQFEFQILPQMLNYLNLDSTEKSVDWGVLAVYTCSKNCDGNPAYKREFLWKQDISSS